MKFTSLLKKTAIAATLVGVFGAANAAVYSLGTISAGAPLSFAAYGGGTGVSSFEDIFSFSLPTGTTLSGYSVSNFSFILPPLTSYGASFTSFSLYSTSSSVALATTTTSGALTLSLPNVATSAGNYYLSVSGVPTGTSGYFYTGAISASVAAITPAVPEPETYAMLLAGLGVMGFIARRRNKAAA